MSKCFWWHGGFSPSHADGSLCFLLHQEPFWWKKLRGCFTGQKVIYNLQEISEEMLFCNRKEGVRIAWAAIPNTLMKTNWFGLFFRKKCRSLRLDWSSDLQDVSAELVQLEALWANTSHSSRSVKMTAGLHGHIFKGSVLVWIISIAERPHLSNCETEKRKGRAERDH